MKILIIEDEASLLEVMTSFLEKEQYVVESANTYQGALSKVADYDYDCILLDIMLPDGDGIDLLKELQKIKKNQKDRKSTRLNSSHANISYAVFCLKKKKQTSLT